MTVKEYLLSQLTAYTAKVKAWVNGKLALMHSNQNSLLIT